MKYSDFRYHYKDIIFNEEIEINKRKEIFRKPLHCDYLTESSMIEYLDDYYCIIHTNIKIPDLKEV